MNVYSSKSCSRYVRMSPSKVRRVLDQIRGCSFIEALDILSFMPYRACNPILKTLLSAAWNIKQKNVSGASLLPFMYIVEAYADKGPTMKRFRPRAQGRGFPIQKPTCHISITLGLPVNN